MNFKSLFPQGSLSLALVLASSTFNAGAHALVVDVDSVTPGIQTSASYLPGTVFTADIYLISDGVTPLSAYGIATEFNDTAGVLSLVSGTSAGAAIGLFSAPVDAYGGFSIPPFPGIPLASPAFTPFGTGPGGAFTSSAGVSGYSTTVPIALPAAGSTIVLQSMTFIVSGTVGSSSDIVALGVLPAGPLGPGAGGVPGSTFPAAPGGAEFYDIGFGVVPAAPVPGSGYAAATNPGTITVVPEPASSLLAVLGGLLCLARRQRK